MQSPSAHHPTSPIALLAIALCGLTIALHAHAEAPMHTDDAGTLSRGAMKLEGVVSRDDTTRGADLIFGAGIAPYLEGTLQLGRARDSAQTPSTQLSVQGLSLKWVPLQAEQGWSAGARLDLGRTRVHEKATAERFTQHEYAVTALATNRFANGQVLHLNAGHKTAKVQGVRQRAATWAVGYEIPLHEQWQLTSEVYGEQRSRPDKALGVRYAIAEGIKASAAVGRGNGRTFGQVGFAWEF